MKLLSLAIKVLGRRNGVGFKRYFRPDSRGARSRTRSPDRGIFSVADFVPPFSAGCFCRNRRIQRAGAFCEVSCSRLRGYLAPVLCLLALQASANSIRRRIASEREGLSFCCLAQASILDVRLGGRRTARTGSRPVAGRPGFFGITFSLDRFAMFW